MLIEDIKLESVEEAASPQLLARDVTAAMLEVKKKSISLLLQLYFHVNSSRKNCFVLTFNMAALSRGCRPRRYSTRTY